MAKILLDIPDDVIPDLVEVFQSKYPLTPVNPEAPVPSESTVQLIARSLREMLRAELVALVTSRARNSLEGEVTKSVDSARRRI